MEGKQISESNWKFMQWKQIVGVESEVTAGETYFNGEITGGSGINATRYSIRRRSLEWETPLNHY
jgi:hypothetical protein